MRIFAPVTWTTQVQKTVSDYSSLLRPMSLLLLFMLAYMLVSTADPETRSEYEPACGARCARTTCPHGRTVAIALLQVLPRQEMAVSSALRNSKSRRLI